MDRRRLLGYLLRAGVLLPFSFFKRGTARAAAVSSSSQVAISQLSSPWSFVEVEFTKQIKTHRGLQPSTFPGYIIKLPDVIGKQLALKDNLYAISRICPHEGCVINFYKERDEVAFEVQVEGFPNPMLVCPCHKSVFDPAQGGKVLSGPAPRPPWTFEFVVDRGRVIIKDLEPGGEKWG